jgi:hypothetical protein
MTHKYPYGAIENERGLLFGMLGKTLYGVHGLGSSSFLTVMENCRNLHTSVFSDGSPGFRRIDYTNADKDRSWDSGCCLGDYNLGAHHNKHYLFHNRADAEAYLAWALKNTTEIKKRPFYY